MNTAGVNYFSVAVIGESQFQQASAGGSPLHELRRQLVAEHAAQMAQSQSGACNSTRAQEQRCVQRRLHETVAAIQAQEQQRDL